MFVENKIYPYFLWNLPFWREVSIRGYGGFTCAHEPPEIRRFCFYDNGMNLPFDWDVLAKLILCVCLVVHGKIVLHYFLSRPLQMKIGLKTGEWYASQLNTIWHFFSPIKINLWSFLKNTSGMFCNKRNKEKVLLKKQVPNLFFTVSHFTKMTNMTLKVKQHAPNF